MPVADPAVGDPAVRTAGVRPRTYHTASSATSSSTSPVEDRTREGPELIEIAPRASRRSGPAVPAASMTSLRSARGVEGSDRPGDRSERRRRVAAPARTRAESRRSPGSRRITRRWSQTEPSTSRTSDDAEVHVGRESPVELDLAVDRPFSSLAGREVEEVELHRLLELVRRGPRRTARPRSASPPDPPRARTDITARARRSRGSRRGRGARLSSDDAQRPERRLRLVARIVESPGDPLPLPLEREASLTQLVALRPSGRARRRPV